VNFFTKADSCRLLADPEGPAAQRYRHYDAFLNHNHRALRLLSELELLDKGAGLATLAGIQRRTEDLLEEVRGLITALCGLSDNRYREIIEVCADVVQEIAPLLERQRPIIKGPLTLPFADIGPEQIDLAGSKAGNLARITNELRLPAPDGFVVTTAGFDLFMRENQLLPAIEAMLAEFDPDGEKSVEICRHLQDAIMQAPLPQSLAEAIDRECRDLATRQGDQLLLAVRSSAVGEDTEASFAGQYKSVLSVQPEAVASAYKKVLASKYTPRAILYRLRYGLTDAATPMAVAVVTMIKARASGVLYTVDPSHPSAGQIRIDAAAGQGEQVVGGSASPDVFRIDREQLEIIEQSMRGEEGIADAQEPPAAIAAATAIDLARLGMKLEAHFGSPQDIEWAEDEQGQIVFLQSRPLRMAASRSPSPPVQSNDLKVLLSGGQTASPGQVSGKAVHVTADWTAEGMENAILVARTAAPDLAALMGKVRGVITDLGGVASHLASVAREFNVPALFDTREATAKIPEGQAITLLADEGTVYLGEIAELARKLPGTATNEQRGPIGTHLRHILDRISPLNLTDPEAPEFSPGGCRTVHDLIRFAHEKAVAEMFNLSDLSGASVVSRKMSANIPLSLYFIDLGGGLAAGLTSCDEIRPEQIRSRPMAALWRGLVHPGVTWTGGVDLTGRNFMTLMAGSMGPGSAKPLQIDSYALVSGDYLNLSVKFAYHYSNLDALCSDDADANTITLQFSGGAGTRAGRALRIEFLTTVLSRLGYEVEARGDLLQAALKGLDCPAMEEVLDQTGRLLGCSRLLDLAIPNQTEVRTLVDLFFAEEYDFLGRSEKRLPGFHASVGEWSLIEFEGEQVLMQNGSHMGDSIACTLHSTLDTVLGNRYRKFLENRHALHYYPVAVQRDSRLQDGRIQVDIRIVAGCVDLAAGLAFGLTNVGNSMVLAVDMVAGELQLLEFINNARHFRKRVSAAIPMDQWFRLEVTIAGDSITALVDGKPGLHFIASQPVVGYIGLWSKGDTTAYYRNLNKVDSQGEAGM
jgi:pyruvate, water dikinase